MSTEMLAIMELVVRTGCEMDLIMAKLQTEPSAKTLHGLQGENAGYKEFLSAISAAFEIRQASLNYNGEQPTMIPDLSDEQLDAMRNAIDELIKDERWERAMGRLKEKTEGMKTFLLFEASSSADLDIAQGKQRSFTSYESLFNAVSQEVSRRAADAERKREEPDLPFNESNFDYNIFDNEENIPAVSGGKPFAVIRGGQE